MRRSASGPCRAARLLMLRDLLHSRGYTVAELAEICGVSDRTIYRDFLDLQIYPLNVALLRCDGRWRAFDPRKN